MVCQVVTNAMEKNEAGNFCAWKEVLIEKKIFRKNLKELRELASGYLRKENSRSWEHRVKRDWCLSCLLCLRTAWRPVWLE